MTVLAVLLFAFRAATAALGFALHVEGENDLRVTLSGPAAELSPGPFHGSITINGSASEMPVSGTVTRTGALWQLPVVVRYAEVPEDWANRFQPETFTYRLKGSAGGAPREWNGARAWKDVEVEGSRETMSEFVELGHVRLTHMSLLSSEAKADVTVRNPFAFPLKIASTEYTLFADDREVGEGQTQGMILHPGQKNTLSLPIEIDHSELLSAAGAGLLSGGDVAVRLDGKLVVRLKGGDIAIPLHLSGHLSSAS